MKGLTLFVVLAGVAGLCLFIVPLARAGEWNQETILTFSAPVRLPHVTLPAGTYTVQLADDIADRDLVLVFNADRTRLLDIEMTAADYRPSPTGRTVIKFVETRSGIDAVKEWFYPGTDDGHEFIYPDNSGVKSTEVTAKLLN
jgi:hypothetical protein